jgi:leucyl aminopeptidase
MRLMKKDMGGAAHAIALARLIMQRKLPVRLQMLVPTVENAISGNAFRPGDVVRTRKGLTVEIGNTDAEGRVILCDALAYAVEGKPRTIIDFATLTGAARVALGPELPVLFANDEKLAAKLLAKAEAATIRCGACRCGATTGASSTATIADFNNSGRGGYGGSIVARSSSTTSSRGHRVGALRRLLVERREPPGRPVGGEAQGLRAVLAAIE